MPSSKYTASSIMRPSLFQEVSSPPRKAPRNSKSDSDIRTHSIHPDSAFVRRTGGPASPRTPSPLFSETKSLLNTEVFVPFPRESPVSPTSTTDLCLILDHDHDGTSTTSLEHSFPTVALSRQTRLMAPRIMLDDAFEFDDDESIPSFFDDEISQWSCSDDEEDDIDAYASWGEEEEEEEELLGLSFIADEKTEAE